MSNLNDICKIPFALLREHVYGSNAGMRRSWDQKPAHHRRVSDTWHYLDMYSGWVDTPSLPDPVEASSGPS